MVQQLLLGVGIIVSTALGDTFVYWRFLVVTFHSRSSSQKNSMYCE